MPMSNLNIWTVIIIIIMLLLLLLILLLLLLSEVLSHRGQPIEASPEALRYLNLGNQAALQCMFFD